MFKRLNYVLAVAGIFAAAALALAFKREHSAQLFAEISLVTSITNPGLIDVGILVHHLDPGSGLNLEFGFPQEAVPISEVSFEGVRQGDIRPRSERDRRGIAIQFPRYEITPKAETIQIKYKAKIGGALATLLSKGGPHYGYADREYIVTQLDYIAPTLPHSRPIRYTAHLRADGYAESGELTSATGQTYSDGTYRAVLAAGRFSKLEGRASRLWVAGGAAPDPKIAAFSEQISQRVTQIFSAHQSPAVLALPSVGGETYFPMRSERLVAMDLAPLTPERAVRLGGTLTAALLRDTPSTRQFSKKDEFWLVDGLARYYGYRLAADFGLVAEEQIAESSMRLGPQRPNLSDWSAEAPTAEWGAFTIFKLQTLLRHDKRSLDSVIARFFAAWFPFSFYDSLAWEFGLTKTRAFWNEYVTKSNAIALSAPLNLSKQPSGAFSEGSISRIRVSITSDVDGYMELCGCKFDQAGGASRRASYLATQRGEGSLQLDLGDFLSEAWDGRNDLEELEAAFQVGIMQDAQYDAVVLGAHEMTRLRTIGGLASGFTSANVPGSRPWRVFRLANHRVAVVGWLDAPPIERYQNLMWLNDSDYREDLLRSVLRDAAKEVDAIILAGNIRPGTIRKVADDNVKLAAVFSAYPSDERPGYIGDTYVMFVVGTKYAVLTVNGALQGPQYRVSDIQTRRLDDTIPDDSKTRQRLDTFYNSPAFVAAATLASAAGVRMAGVRGLAGAGAFVGSGRCFACHVSQQKQWKATAHSSAFATMYRTRRNHHPGCVQCHVTGFGRPGGYSMADRRGNLENVGCESCHGPGQEHVKQPRFDNIVRSPRRHVCQTCHTSEHSSFDDKPEQYVKKVVH